MFSKIVHVADKDVPQRILDACKGVQPNQNWNNTLPVNLREITFEEFAQSKFFTYTPDFKRFNQCPEKAGGTVINWHEYWYSDGTGFAFVGDYWGKKVRVFALGCAHTFEEMRSAQELAEKFPEHAGKFEGGMCFHTTVCTKCRVLWKYDSSG